jgi:hypothetical protein
VSVFVCYLLVEEEHDHIIIRCRFRTSRSFVPSEEFRRVIYYNAKLFTKQASHLRPKHPHVMSASGSFHRLLLRARVLARVSLMTACHTWSIASVAPLLKRVFGRVLAGWPVRDDPAAASDPRR